MGTHKVTSTLSINKDGDDFCFFLSPQDMCIDGGDT